ncbi:MAG: CoA ester lyase [Candidatus Methylomirabilales bacterium]
MGLPVRRSTLILPVNVPRFVEKAHLRGADAVMLDLEDAVPAQEKAAARGLVRGALSRVARGGAEVLVRVNHDAALLAADLDSAVHAGLDGIVLPKTESADEVRRLDAAIGALERRRGLPQGRIELQVLIETPRGLLNVEAIAAACTRVRSMSLGPEDYCLALGVEPSADGVELLYGVSRLVAACRAHGISALGLVGSIAGFRDLAAFERCAERARQLGCVGASCIHPDQVAVLNRVFAPRPEAVERARAAVAAFEAGLARGTASVSLDGAMVDIPVYRRAQHVLELADAVAAVERRKAEALARL